MEKAKAAVDKVLGGVLVLLMALAVVVVLWQVYTRYVLGAPSTFTAESSRYLLIWIGILGAGYAVGQRAHLALDLLPERLTGRRRLVLGLVIEACIMLFTLFVMIVGGMRLVYIQLTLGQLSPTLGIPLGYVYLVVPLSGGAILFYTALHALEQVRRLNAPPAETGMLDPSEDGHKRMPSNKETMPSGKEQPPVPE